MLFVGAAQASASGTPARAGRAAGSAAVEASVAAAAKPNSILWGAYVGTQFSSESVPWDMAGWRDFRSRDAGGKGMSIAPYYLGFNDCNSGVDDCSPYLFPSTQMSSIRSQGSIPMMSWGSYSLADSTKNVNGAAAIDPNFTLAQLVSGKYDSYITQFAKSAAAWGHPFFLRFDWEMNGNWYAWGQGVGKNTSSQFVAAWRHIYGIFQKQHATNASFVWCPSSGDLNDLKALYPGNKYVAWTCADVYNFGLSSQGSGWQSFSQALSPVYTAITKRIAPTKPFMIGEFGSVSAGGSQARWLSQALSQTPVEFPNVKAMVLFDNDPNNVGLALTNPASSRAFTTGIRRPVYIGNRFSRATKIPVP